MSLNYTMPTSNTLTTEFLSELTSSPTTFPKNNKIGRNFHHKTRSKCFKNTNVERENLPARVTKVEYDRHNIHSDPADILDHRL